MCKAMALAASFAVFPLSGWSTTFMDAAWAQGMCDAWNKSTTLVTGLAGKDWMDNNGGRGFKMLRLYRDKCGPASAVQLTIVPKDGKAMCQSGGAPSADKMDLSLDYLMHATDEDWMCMGKGSWGCGAMGAMMTGKLKFDGPKMEAMGVMDPFNAFLQLVDDVPGDASKCP